MEDPRICAQRKKCRKEETETLLNVSLETTDLGSFEALSDHGDDVDGDECTESMPPLPPDSWYKRTETLCGSFGNLAVRMTETNRIHSLIVGMSKNSSTFLHQMDRWARNAPKSVPDVKG